MSEESKYSDNVAAISRRRKLYIEMIKKLCPVFKTTCKKEKCMSFFGGTIHKMNENEWLLLEPCCNIPLITGQMDWNG